MYNVSKSNREEVEKLRKRLIEIRKKNGYTQEQMAYKLNVARTTYTGYENGNFSPSLETALQIKNILNYKKDDIFLISNDSKTNKEEVKINAN